MRYQDVRFFITMMSASTCNRKRAENAYKKGKDTSDMHATDARRWHADSAHFLIHLSSSKSNDSLSGIHEPIGNPWKMFWSSTDQKIDCLDF